MLEKLWDVAFGPLGFFRVIAVALSLAAIGGVVFVLVKQDIDAGTAHPAAVAAVLAIVGWALWNPASSERRLFGGIFAAARMLKYGAFLGIVAALVAADFRMADGRRRAVPPALLLVTCLILEKLFEWRLERGHCELGAGSILLRQR